MFCMNTSFDLGHSAVVHTQHICKINTYAHYKLYKYFKVGKIIIPFTSGVTGSDPLSGFPRAVAELQLELGLKVSWRS